MTLYEFIEAHTERGSCRCGRCADTPDVEAQPEGHTVDLTFFKLGLKGEPDVQRFKELVAPLLLPRAEETSYITLGAEVGDQGTALRLIGLGHLLGVWQALTPDTLMPFLAEDLKQQMAGMGMVSIKGAG